MGCLLILTILIVVLMAVILGVLALAVSGAVGMILFGDVIICGLFVYWLVKRLRKKR